MVTVASIDATDAVGVPTALGVMDTPDAVVIADARAAGVTVGAASVPVLIASSVFWTWKLLLDCSCRSSRRRDEGPSQVTTQLGAMHGGTSDAASPDTAAAAVIPAGMLKVKELVTTMVADVVVDGVCSSPS